MAQPVSETIDFPNEEEKILQLWEEIDAFQTSMKLSEGRPRYSFYDGPPFATGLPHYGHILAGTIKDIVTRYASLKGYYVERRFGWDCHGLPIEFEIDKILNIKGPEDVEKIGIAAYNQECRKIVMRYSKEWKCIVTRLGRWIDFDNDYKTMYPSFMESVWYIFRQLFVKGLVYKGYKVMPFSTACNTPLSNFEVGQNYKEVNDPAIIVSFPILDDPEVSLVAWTTTPWTLPSNLSVCVNADLDYIKLLDKSNNKIFILMEARLCSLYRSEEEYTILEKFKGKTLEGKKYKPLFTYFEYMREKTGCFQVLCDGYVSAESGTGVVQQAPYFGEDDYRVCSSYGLITKDMPSICPVDACGQFTSEVTDYKGIYIKDADKDIVKYLKSQGRLVHQGTVTHNYPFCWRSDTPLIYKAVPSIFIRVAEHAENLLKCNQETYWVPDFVKEKRFANWLKDARDWAVSRNRYWGTPIPLWVSDDGEEVVCIGSRKELEELTGTVVSDIHRDSIDHLTIPSKQGKGVLRRVPEVFDCWFESGCMPYAQVHYPFENKKVFHETFPADFIAEGIDQTRGWFYTLLVLSTLLFGKPPFKNLISNGLVLAQDGQKMSKRKKNYPDPLDIVNKYGADALRLYLINSPVVRADNLKFKEEGVRDILKDVFLPWYNAYRFLMMNIDRLQRDENMKFVYDEEKIQPSPSYMDCWILSFTQSLIKYVQEEMAAYHLYTVIPRLLKFVDQLTNWYVRMNRKRLKGEFGSQDCLHALETLFSVLFCMTKVMAPFIPFLTEHMYQNLRQFLPQKKGSKQDMRSIHFLSYPSVNDSLIKKDIERAVFQMQCVIEMGRVVRDRKTLPVKYPLKEVVAIHKDPEALEDIKSLESYILEELNIKQLTVTTDKEKYGVTLGAEPNHRILGTKYKKEYKDLMAAIRKLSDNQLAEYQNTEKVTVLGNVLVEDELQLSYKVGSKAQGESSYEAHYDNDLLIMLDVTPDKSMVEEGIAREVINRIQKLRKKAHLVPADNITIFYKATPNLAAVIKNNQDFIYSTIKQPLLPDLASGHYTDVIIKDSVLVKSDNLEMTIVKGQHSADMLKDSSTYAPVQNGVTPTCKYVNLELCNVPNNEGRTGSRGTLLLENPQGCYPIKYKELVKQIQSVFGLRSQDISVFLDRTLTDKLKPQHNSEFLNSRTLYVGANNPAKAEHCPKKENEVTSPICHFANVQLVGNKPANGKKGTILLENPQCSFFSFKQLESQVKTIFGLDGKKKVRLSHTPDGNSPVKDSVKGEEVRSLHSSSIFVLQS
ncbi:isoleucine--tRNA ligase, cytoplasmic [Octopus bimaculoides]|uniref:Isoleucine--tRNA ligase, cytoplasmic n=1 Tax=Octopus bimaculoides TaxID=37653 RepID=A0A0L8G0R8_OCTBM|nr:isoleucine--tRNA ligase, cytoplasmic [Octopus bimaculoides]|eukprot:XP_014785277.1 PREDICTED: isoleucine--tRNA ligase, cytoplasmic-like [Octopus bimaculoides]